MGGYEVLDLRRRKHIAVLQHACVMHQQPQSLGVDWNRPHHGSVKIGDQRRNFIEREAEVDEFRGRMNSAAADVRGARERGHTSTHLNLFPADMKNGATRQCNRENKAVAFNQFRRAQAIHGRTDTGRQGEIWQRPKDHIYKMEEPAGRLLGRNGKYYSPLLSV